MKNIVLIGFMGAGKSTLLNALIEYGSLDSRKAYDLDAEIELRCKKNIGEIIEEEGLLFFRQKETEVFQDLLRQSDLIIACGGGIVESVENVKLLQQSICIFLEAPVEVLFQRVIDSKTNRPLAKKRNEDEYNFLEFKRLYESRLSLYRKNADLIYDTHKMGIKFLINEILKLT